MRLQGFTLVEVLVVMVILSLLTGFIAPNFGRVISSLEVQAKLDRIRLIVGYIPELSRAKKNDFVLNTDFQLVSLHTGEVITLPEIPEGFRISTDKKIKFLANGYCSGGVLEIENADETWKWQLTSPYCQPLLIDP